MPLSRKNLDFLLENILSLYPETIIELDYETPFQLMVAVMLSAQTTDKQVNRVTPPLFARVKTGEDLLSLSYKEVEALISSVNFYRNKAKFIYASAQKLVQEFHGEIPNDLTLLQTFPGVGIKTAKVILSVLYDAPYIGVDTHIHRVCNRLGIVRTKTPNETDREIEKIFTTHEKARTHHAIVLFGRYVCTARRPHCETCVLREKCQYLRLRLK